MTSAIMLLMAGCLERGFDLAFHNSFNVLALRLIDPNVSAARRWFHASSLTRNSCEPVSTFAAFALQFTHLHSDTVQAVKTPRDAHPDLDTSLRSGGKIV